MKNLMIITLLIISNSALAQSTFSWPTGNKMAISLSFDDARESQVLIGTNLLNQFGVKATFYVVPTSVKKQLAGWQQAVESGHEIGNHTLKHPCSGNFSWSRKNALEDYSLEMMRDELLQCSKQIKDLLKVDSKVFAYPCGQKYIGYGVDTKSYVPLVAEMFLSGRSWMDEAPNDPLHCNFSQLTCIGIDDKSFEEILPLIHDAKENGNWLIFGGHEINEEGYQTTRIETLRKLMEYVNDPNNSVWIQPVGTVAKYIMNERGLSN